MLSVYNEIGIFLQDLILAVLSDQLFIYCLNQEYDP
jgi:hypothetical protein